MHNIYMYPHTGSGNHGCEAIVRGTNRLLGDDLGVLFSDNPQEDRYYIPKLPLPLESATDEIQRFSGRHFKALLGKYLLRKADAFDRETFSPLLKVCRPESILMSIGGDLYCYEPPEYIYRVNRYVREKGCKTVLWGCSVEPSYINDAMRADLAQYDLICARETITYEALKPINPNTILVADPAFVMEAEPVELPARSYIGVNVSPLITKREKFPGITMENYVRMIRYILDHTDDCVALIPHVVWQTNDDREPLRELKGCFADNDRVILVDDHNAVQQKYIISKCRMFVGARTHATIAAYSTGVPTLVVGYSVKARGIARDLFGRHEDYVLPVQSLEDPEDLSRAFAWLMAHEDQIRSHLREIMPGYIQRAWTAADAVRKLERGEA